MGKLERSHFIETAIWLLFFVVFFIASFEFNQPIEIYKFGATGWPRTILLLSLIHISEPTDAHESRMPSSA